MPNVIVTGGSRGLGLGIAKTLCAAGHDVIAIARRESEALTEAMNTASAGGGRLDPLRVVRPRVSRRASAPREAHQRDEWSNLRPG